MALTRDEQATAAAIKDELERAKQRFEEAWSQRELWDFLVDRKLPTKLPPELTGMQEGLDYQSPDAEKAIFDLVDFLMINRTMWAISVMEQGSRAKDWGRDILLTLASGWEQMSWGRWVEAATAEGQVGHGVKVMQLCHHDPDEYDPDAKPKELARARWPWYLKNTPTLSCYWFDREQEIDAFWCEYDIPLIDAWRDLKNKDGQRLGGWREGKGVWMGDDEMPDKDAWNNRFRVLVRDARNPKNIKCPLDGCDHYLRQISYYVTPDGGSFDEAELMDEYDSPYPRCSFKAVAGRKSNRTDPHRKYRPLLFPLFTELRWRNFLVTLLATLSRRDYSDEDVMIELTAGAKAMGVELPEPGPDGSVKYGKAGPGEYLVVAGKPVRIPKNISEHLAYLIELSDQKIRDYLPNPFIMGTNFAEAREGTGTANVAATQQARLPFDRMLTQLDAFKVEVMDDIAHAIRFWSHAGLDYRFYQATSGGLPIKTSYEDGELVYISAEKVSIAYQLKLKTKSETLQEQQEAYLLAKDQHAAGFIDTEQVWEAGGITDIEGQRRRVLKEGLWNESWPKYKQAMLLLLDRIVEAEAGINLGQMMGVPALAPPGPGGNGSAPPQNGNYAPRPAVAVRPPAIQGATSAGVGQ